MDIPTKIALQPPPTGIPPHIQTHGAPPTKLPEPAAPQTSTAASARKEATLRRNAGERIKHR